MNEKALTPAQAKEKLHSLIKSMRIAMLTTVDKKKSLRSRPMAVVSVDENAIWFMTRESSPKKQEIKNKSQVNVSFSNPSDSLYVSVSGPAAIVTNRKKIDELWKPFHRAWFPKGKEDPNIALLQITIENAEYWDSPSSTMVQLVGMAKAILTGKTYDDGGEHRKIHLKK